MAVETRNVKGLLGKKLGMTQGWDENNKLVPITVVEAGENIITQIKTSETDGYEAIQVAYGAIDPKEIVQERYERLLEVVNQVAWDENLKQIGNEVEVLVANGEGRKDSQTHRMSGRAKDNRLVHFDIPASQPAPRPGDVVTVTVTDAKPYFLIADSAAGSSYSLRRTRGGDAHERRELESCGAPTPGSTKISLGLPIRTASVL
jgi:hypothetical protein